MASNPPRRTAYAALLLIAVTVGAAVACRPASRGATPLVLDRPIHLEDRLDAAHIVDSGLLATLPRPVEWRFDEEQPDWRPLPGVVGPAVAPRQLDDALRLPLTREQPHPTNGRLVEGYFFVDLTETSDLDSKDWNVKDWAWVEIAARAPHIGRIGLMFNYTETDRQNEGDIPFYTFGDQVSAVDDGTVQTYRLRLDSSRMRPWEGPWTHLGLWFNARLESVDAALEILSIRIVPAEADFADEPFGVRMARRGSGRDPDSPPSLRRSLFVHTPSELSYRVRVAPGTRLDVGLGVIKQAPIDFSISVESPAGDEVSLLETTWSDPGKWLQQSLDLEAFSGQTVTLRLGAAGEAPGGVALWSAPTLTAERPEELPNIVLYVIDGGGADYVSAYGYDRPTPVIDRLASSGALFERAHSNSGWTRPSTASFLTSLQHSTLGGSRNGRNPVPRRISTLAEHLHRAGYQTALFTSNANAGRISDLDRGNDWFRDAGVENWSTSSVDLFRDFERWRAAYPGGPFFVHFQSTDVHNPHDPREPFAGRYIDAERRRMADDWTDATEEVPETDDVGIREALEIVGADAVAYWTSQRDLHDECMAHQDHRIGELVEWLDARGELENTLIVVASDHSVAAGSWDYSLLMRDPTPPHVYHDDRAAPQFRSGISRIPLLFVWPGHIAAGLRLTEPVSMIDLLPTLLDLVGLPQPEVRQGRSLAPILRGDAAEERQPVFLDEFEVDPETSELQGRIEIVDGRWGASLEINPDPEIPEHRRRPAPLLLYDLTTDPECLDSIHEEHPELVEHYTALLEAQLEAHVALGRHLEDRAESSPLDAEQLETLRSLGYIQ